MMNYNLQFFGGRGAGSEGDGGLPTAFPQGGRGANRPSNMDQLPGTENTAAEALGQQGRPMNLTNAVKDANPNYDLGPEYQFNCQRCIIATEARLRGYDVQALPTSSDDTMPNGLNYLSNFVNPNTTTISRTTARARQNSVESEMSSYGDGSRAVMSFGWSGGGSGHVINVVQRNGRTGYYDGQTGEKYDAGALFNAMSRSGNINLTRVDNLAFSDTVNRSVRPTVRR